MSAQKLRVKKLSASATIPSRESKRAAGYDLFSARELIIPAKGKGIVFTDLVVSVPSGCYGRVAPRSGLAVNHFIDVLAGVIDEDYRGPLGVVLANHSGLDFKICVGDRVAQLILEKIETPEVEETDQLDDTERGAGGFGSTGGFGDKK